MINDFMIRSNFLHNSTAKQLWQRTSSVVEEILKEIPLNLPPGTRSALAFDVIYSLCQHQRWQRCPILYQFIADMLHVRYQLNDELCDILSQCLQDIYSEDNTTDGTSDQLDYYFLFYIFIYCVTHRHRQNLEAELGLGPTILNTIRSATEQDHEATPQRVAGAVATKGNYVPRIEALLNQVVVEIAQEKQNKPWIFDIYRLNLQLQNRLPYLAETRSDAYCFDIIHHLAEHPQTTTKGLQSWLKSNQPKWWQNSPMDLLTILCQHGYIFRDAGSKRWSLGDGGYQIIANAYATAFHKSKSSKSRIDHLHPRLQEEIIGQWPLNQQSSLLKLLTDGLRHIAPSAVRPLITRLLSSNDPMEITELALAQLKNAPTWHRLAVLDLSKRRQISQKRLDKAA